MNNRPSNKEAGAGVRPDASSGNHLEAGAAPNNTDQLILDFSAPLPPGAYDGVEQAEENTEDSWRRQARQELEVLARTGLTFTADDLVKLVGAPDHPNRIGAAFMSARKAGVIVPTGMVVPSTTPSRHGGVIRCWRGAAA